MDTPATPSPAPVNGPATPATRSWLAENGGSLLITLVMCVLVVTYLNVFDVIKVLIGLGLVIFIHELGHFAAAKWCDVHVETFSIGFGPAIPGCRFKYGETTYMVGMIPLGGYVKMVGEGDAKPDSEEDEPDEDPRSFRNKGVFQRMLIISAGVIMNIFLAAVCFVIVYMHGVEERPAIVGRVESGSAAWRDGLHSNMQILEIAGKQNPWFADIQPIVMSSAAGEEVKLIVSDPDDAVKQRETSIEPLLDGESLFPLLGIGPQLQLLVAKSSRPGFVPTRSGSAASRAEPPFMPADRIIGMSDPTDPAKVTPLPPDPIDPSNDRRDYSEYVRRVVKLRGQTIIVQVLRDGETTPTDITVPVEYHSTFGLRMVMGEVAVIRKNSPAANATPIEPATATAGIQVGDRIIEIEVPEADGTMTQFVNEPLKGANQRVLDPVRLSFDLEEWSQRSPENRTIRVTVLRQIGHKKEERVLLKMDYDAAWIYYRETVNAPTSPLSIPGLGVAYFVETTVDAVAPGSAAEKAGLLKGDVIKQIQPNMVDPSGQLKPQRWIDLKPNQWGFVFTDLQNAASLTVNLRIERAGSEPMEFTLTAVPDNTWPAIYRGIFLRDDARIQQASSIVEALGMGANRTVRTIKLIYQNLLAMFVGRVSAWTMSGPLTIASVSYSIAGENIWQFILFIGMISVNLAVINFLPIPVLDGGHMVFLIYEKIRGKPAPEKVQVAAMFVGLAMILSLMVFVMFLDVRRMFF